MRKKQKALMLRGHNRFNFLFDTPLTFKTEDNGDLTAYYEGYRLMLAHWLEDLWYTDLPIIVTAVSPMYNKKGKVIPNKLLVRSAHCQRLQPLYKGVVKITRINRYSIIIKIDNCIFWLEGESTLQIYRNSQVLAEKVGRPIHKIIKQILT